MKKGGTLYSEFIPPDVRNDPTFLSMYRKDAPLPSTPNMLSDEQAKELNQKSALYQAQIKKNKFGRFGVPQIDPQVLQKAGIPWYLAQHPNSLSANPNSVLLFANGVKFMTSDFYKKYEDKMVTATTQQGFGGESSNIIAGKPLRIVIRSTDPKDSSQFYLDNDSAEDWIEVMTDAYNSRLLVPVEFVASQNMNLWKQESQKQVGNADALSKKMWTQGYDHAADTYEQAVMEYSQKVEAENQEQLQAQAQAGSSGDLLSGVFNLL